MSEILGPDKEESSEVTPTSWPALYPAWLLWDSLAAHRAFSYPGSPSLKQPLSQGSRQLLKQESRKACLCVYVKNMSLWPAHRSLVIVAAVVLRLRPRLASNLIHFLR